MSNQAYDFKQKGSIAISNIDKPFGEVYTIELMIKPNSLSHKDYCGLVMRGNAGTANGLHLYSGVIAFRSGESCCQGKKLDDFKAENYPIGKWTHIMICVKGNQVKFYRNFELISSVEAYSKSNSTVNTLSVGDWSPNFGSQFDGSIALVRIWEKYLTAEEACINKNKTLSNTTEGLLYQLEYGNLKSNEKVIGVVGETSLSDSHKSKFILENPINNKIYSIQNNALIELSNDSYLEKEVYGMDENKVIELNKPFIKMGKIKKDSAGEIYIEEVTVPSFSVYDYISEKPTIHLISSNTKNVTVTIETEPFTIYDEFVDDNGEPGEIDILYFTDDPDVDEVELEITANWSPLDELEGEKELVVWSDSDDPLSLEIEGLLPETFVHLAQWLDVENLVSINLAASGVPAPLVIQRKYDMAYYSYYQGHFFKIPVNERMIANYGLRPAEVNAITRTEWRNFLQNNREIRFLYMFSNQSIGTQSVSASLDVQHAVGGIKILREIRKATPTVNKFEIQVAKYSMQGRLEEIERVNLNNLMALEMRTALLLNAAELKMHELIVETFDDNRYEVPETIQVKVETPQDGVDANGDPLPPIVTWEPRPKPSSYIGATKKFQGDFTLKIPIEVPLHAKKLYVEADGKELTIKVGDLVKTTLIQNNKTHITDLTGYSYADLYLEIDSTIGQISAISYAWE